MNHPDFLYQLIPKYIFTELLHFVLYDDHPRDNKKIDITVCTSKGEVAEYYKLDKTNSIVLDGLDGASKFQGIRILRNNKSELFYLVKTCNEIIILRRDENLAIHERIRNVQNCDIDDRLCAGVETISIVTASCNLTLDDNFKAVSIRSTDNDVVDAIPFNIELERKLKEAQCNFNQNKDAYRKFVELRKNSEYSLIDRIKCKTGVLQNTLNSAAAGVLHVKNQLIKICNKKILILLEVKNRCNEPINNVHVLIHNNRCNSISYTSMIFKKEDWRKIESLQLEQSEEAYIATVIPISEFKFIVSSKIDFNVVVTYERKDRSYLIPCDNDVCITARDVMGQKFDVFTDHKDEFITVLTLLSTSDKTTLCLRFNFVEDMALPAIFHKYLKMERFHSIDNVGVFKNTNDILYATTILFDNRTCGNTYTIHVYTRSPSQVIALIHYIELHFPQRVIVTTPNIQVTTGVYNNDSPGNGQLNCTQYVTSLLNQTTMSLDYLKNCRTTMLTKNVYQNNIDIFAQGCEKFAEYRDMIIEENGKGIENLYG